MNDTLAHLVRKSSTRGAQLILLVIGAALVFALTAPEAGARTASLHLFSRQTSSTFTTPQGKPLPSNTPPAAGDLTDSTDVDYMGTQTPRGEADRLKPTSAARSSASRPPVR